MNLALSASLSRALAELILRGIRSWGIIEGDDKDLEY